MPKDALTIYRGAKELDFLKGARVDKLSMPDRETVILLFHTSGAGNHSLLLSCNPSLPRAHLTSRKYKNPETASGTLMFFRKRLVGAVLTDIKADKTERMITFVFSALDELKERVSYELAVELTGKCANIVFVKDGIIGNALRRISAEAPGKRAVLPGLKYAVPNPTGRVGIFDGELLIDRVSACEGVSLRAAVNKCVAGLSMTTVDELFFRLCIADDVPASSDAVNSFIAEAKKLYDADMSPVVVFDDAGKPLDYCISPYSTLSGVCKNFPTLNAAMDEYYSALFSAADRAAKLKPLNSAVRSAIAKNKKRLAAAAEKIAESENCDADRICGELITANIYRIKRGDAELVAQNWYDGSETTVKLDQLKNAQQNAAAYFKSYSKKKKAAVYAAEAAKAAEDMLYRLDGISAELELCTTDAELAEVREELESLGLVRRDAKKKKQKPIPSEPYRFDILGATLLVGKNHAQNSRITRSAAKTDIWLHVKDAHGCHAVLKTSSPTDEQIIKAAQKAAYYSQARGADKVPVDYTDIKHVYPRNGGRVEYTDYKTVIVEPQG